MRHGIQTDCPLRGTYANKKLPVQQRATKYQARKVPNFLPIALADLFKLTKKLDVALEWGLDAAVYSAVC